jgi:hypothetical protein
LSRTAQRLQFAKLSRLVQREIAHASHATEKSTRVVTAE